MADRSELPAFSKKRDILFNEKTSDRQRLQSGVEFMQAGRYDDALEFFGRCDAEEQVHEIVDRARRECNVPVFLRAKVILKEKPDTAELEELAVRAEEMERPLMAVLAYQKAGMQEKADRVRAGMGGSGEASEDGDGGGAGVDA